MLLNPLVLDTGSPPIPHAQSWAARYDGSKGPLVNLAQAVPGYPPHQTMLDALARAAGSAKAAGYGAITGDAELKSAYAAHLSSIYGGTFAEANIAITAGCNMAFYVAAIALARAGDNVILPTPWYFNHEMTLRMLGVEARPLPCRNESGFLPDPAEAEGMIDARTRAILLVTPNNPTGAVYPPALIERFARLAERRGVALILDETYRDFLPSGAPHTLFSKGAPDAVLQLYSFSKSYCIPGHRLGAIAGSATALSEIAKILDCMQICAPRTPQMAVVETMNPLAAWREANRLEIDARAKAFSAALAHSNGWRIDSIGAYFAFVAHPYPGEAAEKVAERLCVESGVLALPGSYFGPGHEGHLRFAFANADIAGIEALGRRLRA